MNLTPWSIISPNYRDCLILGNGASITLAPTLSYPSLFEAAKNLNHLDATQQAVFDFFGTHDFEFVLRALSHANAINGYLGVVEDQTSSTYDLIKNTLIKTVKEVHPDYGLAEDKLQPMAAFMEGFPTVFSLNYDLLVYWAIMAANDAAGANLFKDCFGSDGRFNSDYDYLRRPHRELATSTLVFYPHGNLSLATDMWGTETKITNSASGLLDAITAAWNMGGNTPLFVSEGDSAKKLRSIGRNSYLNKVYSELSSPKSSALVYGWGFGVQDSHILTALARAGISRFGVSVYTGGADPAHFCYEVSRSIHNTKGLKTAHIDFFDSCESGVWINP